MTIKEELSLINGYSRKELKEEDVYIFTLTLCDNAFEINFVEADITDALKVGENEIEITIANNLRNLLGPHHLGAGESYHVSPSSFYKRGCIWNSMRDYPYFKAGYSLVKTGLI